MEHIQFGAFIAQLRKEHQMTQRELADRLHVTDKAVSKWETGKGFPDLKLLEPLAQALDVSLVELLQGARSPSPTLTKEEAGQAAVRAMRQSEQITTRRYLRLFRWLLTGILVLCLLFLLPHAALACWHLYDQLVVAPELGVIGSADGPTVIVTTSTAASFWSWLQPLLLTAAALVSFVLALRVRRLEKRLKDRESESASD